MSSFVREHCGNANMAPPHGLPLASLPGMQGRTANVISHKTTFANPRTANLRRPTTTNPSNFWYIGERQWDRLRAEVDIPETAKAALLSLSNFDAAGRIMETAEGILASKSCDECSRPDSTNFCIVYAELNGKDTDRCAYCKCMNISPCSAIHPARHQPVMSVQETNHQRASSEPTRLGSPSEVKLPSIESLLASFDARFEARLKALENAVPQSPTKFEARRLDRMEARDRSLKTHCKALEDMIRVLQDEDRASKDGVRVLHDEVQVLQDEVRALKTTVMRYSTPIHRLEKLEQEESLFVQG